MILSTVGSVFEISLRILLILNETKNVAIDEQQLAATDFIAVYAADFGILDENLHGYGSYRFSEYPARKLLVSSAIKDLVLDGYVRILPTKDGYLYTITEEGRGICRRLTNSYAHEYIIAVQAVMENLNIADEDKMISIIRERTMQSLEEVAYE